MTEEEQKEEEELLYTQEDWEVAGKWVEFYLSERAPHLGKCSEDFVRQIQHNIAVIHHSGILESIDEYIRRNENEEDLYTEEDWEFAETWMKRYFAERSPHLEKYPENHIRKTQRTLAVMHNIGLIGI